MIIWHLAELIIGVQLLAAIPSYYLGKVRASDYNYLRGYKQAKHDYYVNGKFCRTTLEDCQKSGL